MTHDRWSQTTKSSSNQDNGDIGSWHHQTIGNERKNKEYLKRTRKLLKTKLYYRNLVKGINTWADPLVRYSRPFLKWIKEKLKQMGQRTRKLMSMHKVLHPRDDVDRLHMSRREGGRGLASIEDSIDASILRLKDYIEKCRGRLITDWYNPQRTGDQRKNRNHPDHTTDTIS